MNTVPPVPVVPTRPLARLGESHGYRIEGDAAHLRATFRDIARDAHDRSWALQLWACPAEPRTTSGLMGHLVAEAWLPPLAEFEEASADFDVVAAATPPAGAADWVMVLVLVAARGEQFDEVHDLASYPRHERFVQPRLEGDVRQVVSRDQVHVEVATVTNPRDATNVSGTLALELWALPASYTGGRFDGAPLAGVVLGTLAGQAHWDGLAFDLAYTPPPPGTWFPVVMLREWIGNGYVTRDFANVGAPIEISPPVPVEVAPVSVPPAAVPPVAVAPVAGAPVAAAPAKKPQARKTVAVPAAAPKRAKKSGTPKA